MQLTALEIKGFKSFGEKTVINFDEGVTGIVGPNGCGKSNVVDAIRWVLGEQKYTMLRSEKMDNLIFNGSKNKKASGLAEVSLTFKNTKNILPTDYSTVTIQRKLFRNGDSEYYLNDVQCRLKDISSLFLDTGIGSDTYSIISLHMVDDILKDKDNSRKRLFDEASGISKYKVRKKQTFQKLELTQNDLNRVEDLLFEIDGNLKSLESQANKTRKYYQLKEEYKELSVEIAKFSIDSYRKSFDDFEKENLNQKDVIQQIESKIKNTEALLEKSKLDNLSKEKELAESQKEVNKQIDKIRLYENEKQLKNERLKFLIDKENTLKDSVMNDEQSIKNLKEEIKHIEVQKENELSILAELEYNVKESRENIEKTKAIQIQAKTRLDELNGLYINLQQELHHTELDIDRNKTKIESLNQEFERMTLENSTAENTINENNEKLKNITSEKKEKQNEFDQISRQDDQLQQKIKTLENEIDAKTSELVETNRKLDATQNEFNLTKSLIENLEGFPESIKFLKKEANWGKNVPLFSDILFCKSEYRVAIESLLEPYMNFFIADTLEEARLAVVLLSESAKGKANFFILSEIKPETKNNNVKPENFTQALDVIEVDEKYAGLCQKLLGNVFIIENEVKLSEFTTCGIEEIGKKQHAENLIIIDKAGRFIKKAHTLSGGSIGLFEGKRIGRAKNLKELAKNITRLSATSNQLKDEIIKSESELELLAKNSTHEKFNKLREELSNFKHREIELTTKLEYYSSLIEGNKKRTGEINSELENCKKKIDELTPGLNEFAVRKGNFNANLENARLDYDKITDKVNSQTAQTNEENIKVHQQKNKISVQDIEINHKNNQIETLTKKIGSNTIELKKVNETIKEISVKTDKNDDELNKMYVAKEELEKQLQKLEESFYKSRGFIDEIDKEIRNHRTFKEQAVHAETAIKEKINEIKIKINSLKERLLVEFNIDIENIINEKPSEKNNEHDIKEKVEKIKNRLDNYGTINPMAIEAYDEIKKRNEFIIEQKNDLNNAKESLLKTIAEIDLTAREKFMDAFTLIRQNFISVFRSLFSEEDNCDLVMENPEDPLESEIDIIAKPKGKRPLNINQLSSGESTLTAIALLFSLYLLKPAPFCIFDEVDAPLDDTNIEKFNKIIRKFSANSQFILITHNQRTMAQTDVIYGITMPEQGISKVVPVDLRMAS